MDDGLVLSLVVFAEGVGVLVGAADDEDAAGVVADGVDDESPAKPDANPPMRPLFLVEEGVSRSQRSSPNQLACAMDMKTNNASNL